MLYNKKCCFAPNVYVVVMVRGCAYLAGMATRRSTVLYANDLVNAPICAVDFGGGVMQCNGRLYLSNPKRDSTPRL